MFWFPGCWLLVALLVHLRLTVVCLLCGFIFSSVVLANVELLFALVLHRYFCLFRRGHMVEDMEREQSKFVVLSLYATTKS